jgi:hypothetical protein
MIIIFINNIRFGTLVVKGAAFFSEFRGLNGRDIGLDVSAASRQDRKKDPLRNENTGPCRAYPDSRPGPGSLEKRKNNLNLSGCSGSLLSFF